MKEEFFGFYEPTKEEIEKSWKDGFFVFDANALLNLYRYSENTRNDFLLAIDKLKDRLFMPYQVGFEFHNNRRTVIDSLINSYKVLISAIKDVLEKNLKDQLNRFLKHPSIEIANIEKIQEEFFEKITAELEKQKMKHPDFLNNDHVLNQLTEIYKDKVGKPYSKEELKKIYAEGKERYDQLIPPGYKDLENKKKKGEQHMYGDLIIWKEIISFSKKEKKLIVLVTDDRKEDWWTIENGKTIRPREELIKEFYDLSGSRILIYNAASFLHFAKERGLVSEIKEESITEIKEVRKSDETYIQLADFLHSDVFRSSSQFYNPATSQIADLLNSDVIKTSYFYNLGTSQLADFLHSTNAKQKSPTDNQKDTKEENSKPTMEDDTPTAGNYAFKLIYSICFYAVVGVQPGVVRVPHQKPNMEAVLL